MKNTEVLNVKTYRQIMYHVTALISEHYVELISDHFLVENFNGKKLKFFKNLL